ncbi:uncharacterized protein BO80DRAFT_157888 [Aspergillus ibericus CBS 121593]|uniref:Secreted protein n=1 Tax=Aspergillus ibericus CBS 121593 TaxID=1448316 RepID=A0A395GSY1_9EURO|nr:hypothetical protein BO80DRAFT_157888 [Aspergillus ibericus CBS 121593]RAK98526.1 hypothetical protein BO80DRAFT_157888 [Aspergillus ibericus CBS 121593]
MHAAGMRGSSIALISGVAAAVFPLSSPSPRLSRACIGDRDSDANHPRKRAIRLVDPGGQAGPQWDCDQLPLVLPNLGDSSALLIRILATSFLGQSLVARAKGASPSATRRYYWHTLVP